MELNGAKILCVFVIHSRDNCFSPRRRSVLRPAQDKFAAVPQRWQYRCFSSLPATASPAGLKFTPLRFVNFSLYSGCSIINYYLLILNCFSQRPIFYFLNNPYLCISSFNTTYQERRRVWPDDALTTCLL